MTWLYWNFIGFYSLCRPVARLTKGHSTPPPGALRGSPLIQLGGLEEHCKLPSGAWGRKRILCISNSKTASGGHVFGYFYATFPGYGWCRMQEWPGAFDWNIICVKLLSRIAHNRLHSRLSKQHWSIIPSTDPHDLMLNSNYATLKQTAAERVPWRHNRGISSTCSIAED